MHKRFFYYAFMGICTSGMVGLYSCVDNAYDLNNEIDKTITVGGDLTIPGSSTEEMKLKDLLDMEDDSSVKADANGDYFIVQTGDPSDSDVKVNEVNISGAALNFTPNDFSINFPPAGSGSTKAEGNIPEDQGSIDINIEKKGIDPDIVDIEKAYIKKETYTISISTAATGDFEIVNGFQLVFPKYMTIGTDDPNFGRYIDDQGVAHNNIISAKNNVAFVNGKADIDFYIESIDFTKEGAEFSRYHVDENGDESPVETPDMRGKITMGEMVNLDGSLSYEGSASGNIRFEIDITCENIDIAYVVDAIVDPDINIDIKPIEINNLPDFLSDNEVELDLTDPRIFITLTNESPVPATMNATLVSEKDGVEGEPVYITGIEVPANRTNYRICIHQNEKMAIEGVDYPPYIVENLNAIIRNVPDLVKMKDIETKAIQKPITANLGETYKITTDYEINTPLMFGAETKIKYTETMEGMSEDMENAEFENVEISMTAINKIPLGLELSAEAIDANGNKLENVEDIAPVTINAGNDTEGSQQEITFTLKAKEGERMKNLDGLKLTVTGNGSEATSKIQMNEGQSLKLDNVKLKLIGGVTMDLN